MEIDTHCQSCGKKIMLGEPIHEIRTGNLSSTVRYYRTEWTERNFFHQSCDIAVTSEVRE